MSAFIWASFVLVCWPKNLPNWQLTILQLDGKKIVIILRNIHDDYCRFYVTHFALTAILLFLPECFFSNLFLLMLWQYLNQLPNRSIYYFFVLFYILEVDIKIHDSAFYIPLLWIDLFLNNLPRFSTAGSNYNLFLQYTLLYVIFLLIR